MKTGIQGYHIVPCFHRDRSGFPLEFIPHLMRGGNDNLKCFNCNGIVKSRKSPPPWRGRVKVGVISCRISVCYFPLPLVPSRRGRGKFTFYEFINCRIAPFRFNIRNSNDNEGEFWRTLTLDQWMAIRRLVGYVSGSKIYWYVEAWGRLERRTQTEVMNFVLMD